MFLIPVVPILLSHLSVGHMRISSQTTSPMSEDSWTFPIPPIDPVYRMGPFLCSTTQPPIPQPSPSPQASGPSLEAITLGWGGHQAVLGLGVKGRREFHPGIYGAGVWINQGKAQLQGCTALESWQHCVWGHHNGGYSRNRSLVEAKQRGYMGPRSVYSTQLYWGSCLSCLALSSPPHSQTVSQEKTVDRRPVTCPLGATPHRTQVRRLYSPGHQAGLRTNLQHPTPPPVINDRGASLLGSCRRPAFSAL